MAWWPGVRENSARPMADVDSPARFPKQDGPPGRGSLERPPPRSRGDATAPPNARELLRRTSPGRVSAAPRARVCARTARRSRREAVSRIVDRAGRERGKEMSPGAQKRWCDPGRGKFHRTESARRTQHDWSRGGSANRWPAILQISAARVAASQDSTGAIAICGRRRVPSPRDSAGTSRRAVPSRTVGQYNKDARVPKGRVATVSVSAQTALSFFERTISRIPRLAARQSLG